MFQVNILPDTEKVYNVFISYVSQNGIDSKQHKKDSKHNS